MSNLEQFGEAFFPPKQRTVSTAYGTVQSVNDDGSYQVKLNASGTTRCARLCNAAAGDAVFIVMQENGKCAAVGKVGGESSGGGNTYALQGSGVTVSLIENGTTPAGNATIQDASTSQKGVTKLSSATDSTSEALSATPKAVNDALAAAKSYTDAQIVAAGAVTGVKGANQENYQTGNVSLSASDVGAAPSTHVHGSIANDGSIASDTSVATGDKLVMTDASDGAKVKRSGIAIDTTDTSKYLRHDGSWTAPPQPTVPTAYTSTPNMDGIASAGSSTKWARGDHTHPIDTSRAAASHTHAISDVTGLQSALDGKAPTDHSDAATTYGKGTDSKYGHVLLSDSTSSSTAASSGGTAATPKAVKDAYDKAATALSTANSAVAGLDDKAAKTEAIKDISRSGVTFTATRCDNTTFTFTQKDTTYSTMTKSQADTGTGTTGLLITPKVLADYVSEHQGGGQSYTTLYYSLAGSHNNISLSDSAANYDHMRIYFEKDSQTEACASIDVYKPNGRNVSTVLANVYTGGVQFLGAVWYINGTSITRVDNEAWANCASGITGGNTSSYTIQIYRVEAW